MLKGLKYQFYVIALGAVFILHVSCQKDKWNKTSTMTIQQTSMENGEFDFNSGKLEVHEVSLSIDLITVTGARLQADNIDVDAQSSGTFDFLNPGNELFQFEVPQGTYSELNLTFKSNDAANFKMVCDYEHPGQGQGSPEDFEVTIFLNVPKLGPVNLVNQNGGLEHLIQTENSYNLSVQINAQKIFENINLNAWNGIINSQSAQGNNVIEINDEANNSIKNKLIENVNSALKIELNE